MKKSLDREGFVPLYAQIHEELRKLINTGKLLPGATVPSERELSEQYKVSRMTARQALRALRQEGLVYRERGLGTFVSNRKMDVHTRNLGGFTDEMKHLRMKPSSRILLIKRESSSQKLAKELEIKTGDKVFHLERLRLADGFPMAFESAFLPAEICPDLDKYDLAKNSLYHVLKKSYGIKMRHASEVLEAAAATQMVAQLLGIKLNTPVLTVHRVVYSDANKPIESVTTIYRADRYKATYYLDSNNL
jgi:GntR family transcriptional regulator